MYQRAAEAGGGGGGNVDCLTGTVAAGSTETLTIPRPAQAIVTSDKVAGGGGLGIWTSKSRINNSNMTYPVGMDNSTAIYLVNIGQTNVRISSLSSDYKTIGLQSPTAAQGTDYWIYY